MTETSAALTPYLAALRQPEDSAPVQAVVATLGGDFSESEYDYPPTPTRHLEFEDAGAEILLKGGVVESIFFYADDPASDDLLSTLVPGVTRTSTRPDVHAALGEPRDSTDTYDLYAVGDGFLHVEYDAAGALHLVTVMAELVEPAATGDVADAIRTQPADAAVGPLEGDIATFLRVLGLPREAVETTGLADGAQRRDAVVDGVAWHYLFSDDGVDVQIREGVVVGLLVHVARSADRAYPRPETLIDGLPLPTSADTVRDRLGTPVVASPTARPGESFDLYHLADERVVTFDYADGQVVSVSLLLRDGAPA